MGSMPAKTNTQMDVKKNTDPPKTVDSTWSDEEPTEKTEQLKEKRGQQPDEIKRKDSHEAVDKLVEQNTPETRDSEICEQTPDLGAQNEPERKDEQSDRAVVNEQEMTSEKMGKDAHVGGNTINTGEPQETVNQTGGKQHTGARETSGDKDKRGTINTPGGQQEPVGNDLQSGRNNSLGQKGKEQRELSDETGTSGPHKDTAPGKTTQRKPQYDDRRKPKIHGITGQQPQPDDSNARKQNGKGTPEPRVQLTEPSQYDQQIGKHDQHKSKDKPMPNKQFQEMEVSSIETVGISHLHKQRHEKQSHRQSVGTVSGQGAAGHQKHQQVLDRNTRKHQSEAEYHEHQQIHDEHERHSRRHQIKAGYHEHQQVHGGNDRYSRRNQMEAGYHDHQQVHDKHDRYSRQDQMQEQIIREAQASKQMVYGVYGNCITMLEEMEQRELRKTGGKAMSRSDIHLPDQSKFDDNTIKRKMDTQLVLLQAQLTSCHDAIRDEVKDELKANTLHWSSAREAQKIPHSTTDKYAEKMFGLLETGTTKHPKEFHQPPTIDERGMQKALGAILHGNQKRADLDRSFKDDRNKKATGPRMRQSAGIDQGVDRLVKGNPKYEKAANNYRESLR